MEKARILAEIQRTALENGGVALGQNRFSSETGIAEHEWRGRYWRQWGDALMEAGVPPNRKAEAYEKDFLLLRLVELTRNLGKFPTSADVLREKRTNQTFPTAKAPRRLGSLPERVALVRAYVTSRTEHADVLPLLPPSDGATGSTADDAETRATADGSVYMLKLGKHYKIGKSFRVPQRHREIAIELPEKPDVVHVIATDDPSGIEAYWHKRFAEQRTNGEWFMLTKEDIRAFKRRKFM